MSRLNDTALKTELRKTRAAQGEIMDGAVPGLAVRVGRGPAATWSLVLRVRGKSMIDDHIDDGDFVVVQEQSNARDGDIVVALLEDNMATLKRFYKEKDRIRLQPANGTMAPIYARDVQIQGKVIGVIRRLA